MPITHTHEHFESDDHKHTGLPKFVSKSGSDSDSSSSSPSKAAPEPLTPEQLKAQHDKETNDALLAREKTGDLLP